jgi:hypothetical protein
MTYTNWKRANNEAYIARNNGLLTTEEFTQRIAELNQIATQGWKVQLKLVKKGR